MLHRHRVLQGQEIQGFFEVRAGNVLIDPLGHDDRPTDLIRKGLASDLVELFSRACTDSCPHCVN